MKKIALASSIGLVLIACASVKLIPPQPRQIQNTFPYNKSFDAVWQATIEAVAEMNLPIATLEKDSGLITIDWVNFQSQNPETGFCDCGKLNVPVTGNSDGWIAGQPVKPTPDRQYSTWDVRGHFNIFIKRLENGTCEMKINSVFETGQRSCVSTGRLEASLDGIIRNKVM